MLSGLAPGSLRQQVALVIAVLSVLPNVVMAASVLLPLTRRLDGLGSTIWLTVTAWIAGVVLVAVLIGYLLSQQLLAPLTQVTRAIAALPLTSERLLGAQLPLTGSEPAEVGALKRSFNELLDKVGSEQSRRDAFMATVMHDLKTPLVASNHLLAAIRDDAVGAVEREAVVDHLIEENRALLSLVGKLIEAHRLERSQVELQRQPTDVAALVEATVARVAPLARERGLTVRVSGETTANVDRQELERALYNLFANAVRYARSEITVQIFAGLIRISDDGPGLPAPLDELAQPFEGRAVDIAGGRYTAGTSGLGLYIARRILEAHGGRLRAETSAVGTTLLLYLGRSVPS